MYIHELNDWPEFYWDNAKTDELIKEIKYLQGCLISKMSSLGFSLQDEASLKTLTEDVIKTSEIEGENLDKEQVRSSIAKRMGIEIEIKQESERHVEGIVEILMDCTKNYKNPLTEERMFAWHSALFPTGKSGMKKITVGKWRGEDSGVMQVVSGAEGKERIHFEAPGFEKVSNEMQRFIKWFNSNTKLDLILKSAIAHLWFLTIHPFDDGNGRIGRALVDMLLAKSENCGRRFYSMSSQIRKERRQYYLQLEKTQKGSLNITEWIEWFLQCLKHAIESSDETLKAILQKAKFWQSHENLELNERQKKILNMLLDGFTGNLTSSKWAVLCKCSQDTANRDISDLLKKHILKKGESLGRSTHYLLRF